VLCLTILDWGQQALAQTAVESGHDLRHAQNAQPELSSLGTDGLDSIASLFLDETLGER
jgi:hypothetical protein